MLLSLKWWHIQCTKYWYLLEMGPKHIPIQLEHIATNRSRNDYYWWWLRVNPIRIDLFGALWYWGGGTMWPQILRPLLNLKFLSKSNEMMVERYNRAYSFIDLYCIDDFSTFFNDDFRKIYSKSVKSGA